MTRPRHRPHPLDEGIAEAVARRLIGGESLLTICADEDMPSRTDVYVTMAENDAFRTIIARAREYQQEAIADDTVDMADKATVEDHQVVKLRIWARQWRAGKLSARYSDKTVHVGDKDQPIHTDNKLTIEFIAPKP